MISDQWACGRGTNLQICGTCLDISFQPLRLVTMKALQLLHYRDTVSFNFSRSISSHTLMA